MELVKNRKKSKSNLHEYNAKKLAYLHHPHMASLSNKDSLMDMISYLSEIKKVGSISNEQFTELIVMACASYIEKEVEDRVSKSIGDKFFSLLHNI